MELQAVHAIFKDGRLIFADPDLMPVNDSEVLVTYLVRPTKKSIADIDQIVPLRGRGKGERLVEKLLKSRGEDRNRDEQKY
jgi:hypothetical protein